VVAVRSGGVIDWTFLAALAKLAPTVFNIGNHESDLDNDLTHFVDKAQALGVTVVTNMTDKRSGKPFAPAGTVLQAAGLTVNIAALATPSLNTYPKATRETLDIPDPVAWAQVELPKRLKQGEVNIVMSHAGVVADRAILPALPDGTLLIGGHDHLNFQHEQGRTRYVHTGSWATALTIATIDAPGEPAKLERVMVESDGPVSETLKALIPATLAAHLTAEEHAAIAKTRDALPLGQTARFTAAAMAERAGADLGFIGHTSFGAGLPKGDVSRFDYNAALRFDGKIMAAEIDTSVLETILSRCNQDGDIPLAARTGDFLYAAPAIPAGKTRIRIVCNDWSALNRKAYFGREDIVFAELPDLRLKTLVIEALNKA